MVYQILIHNREDNVGIAITEIKAQQQLAAKIMENQTIVQLKSVEPIPFTHKIALNSIEQGAFIIIYGAICGYANQPISKGDHVHVHNINSVRWK